jgi:hypothetical protein
MPASNERPRASANPCISSASAGTLVETRSGSSRTPKISKEDGRGIPESGCLFVDRDTGHAEPQESYALVHQEPSFGLRVRRHPVILAHRVVLCQIQCSTEPSTVSLGVQPGKLRQETSQTRQYNPRTVALISPFNQSHSSTVEDAQRARPPRVSAQHGSSSPASSRLP